MYMIAVVDHYTILQYLCQGYLRTERRLSKQVIVILLLTARHPIFLFYQSLN